MDFSTIALLRGRDALYEKAESLFTSVESRCLYVILSCMNDALTHQRYGSSGIKRSRLWSERFALMCPPCGCLLVLK